MMRDIHPIGGICVFYLQSGNGVRLKRIRSWKHKEYGFINLVPAETGQYR